MRRGDLVTVAIPGDFGKPRPALVVQADQFVNTSTVTVVLISGTRIDAPLLRLDVEPTVSNGLRKPSQVMVDKIMTLKRDKVGAVIGRADDATMTAVSRAFVLVLFLGLA
ncbi:type II toxin-antitoxin system PemK/MazF family toxin [Roseospira navarrensis]|uniref:Type II toxin-antitoxin system PemK/MazF family toxin n=1 Tax=Roseospira navarrensis TaxID=140058 RepID=A0A7X2D3H3_9PROT|nr:type II toxin-antitoxin system PemK/MazF family toxin [Roseospira navarrensis]MQX37404.1 type II toxin-antitoxin system PemK/MazF family toxin [Roseospira navarrensis]